MIDQNKDKNSSHTSFINRWKPSYLNIRKLINSTTVIALLLPNVMSIGVVAAEELPTEEPPVEDVAGNPEEDETVDETPSEDAPTEEVDPVPEEPVEEPVEESNEEPSTSSENPVPEASVVEEETTSEEPEAATTNIAPMEVAPAQVTGIHQDNLVYQNDRLSLINQTPGTNIAAVLPNGTVLSKTVPYHGTWDPLQTLARNKAYVGDVIEFFTYEGNTRGESVFLTVVGEGDTRPADQQAVLYGRQHFGFIPTVNDSRVTYKTEPFFTVEMTFPNGHVETQTATVLGQTSFNFPENYTPKPGQLFSARVFDRNGDLLDLNNLDLFRPLTVPNQSEIRVYGDPIPETYIVTIDPNGGTINEDYRVTEVTEGEKFTLEYAYKSELANTGYDLVGYTVEGRLLDADGNEVTEINRFTAEYTPLSDVTLTAKWAVSTGQFTLTLYDDEVVENVFDVDFVNVDTNEPEELPFRTLQPNERISWRREGLPYGTYKLSIDGYKITKADIRGWKMTRQPDIHEDGTATVYLEFEPNYSANHATLDIEVEPILETYNVTIDPNGGTINEDYRVTEITEGENFTLEYAYKSELLRTGYDLAGYQVDGQLLDANGNEVTEISRFTAEYTPLSDVTLTAIWEVRTGEFQLIVYDENPSQDKYDVTFTHEDGTSYDLEFRYIDEGYSISWDYDEMPYGTYTLSIEGFQMTEANLRGFDLEDSNITISEDGSSLSVHLGYPMHYPAAFAILRVHGEPIIEAYPLGIEVRDLDNVRTSDVGISVKNEDGEVFSGSFNEYTQWLSDEELPVGEYTITLTTPENTVAEINDTVASQSAVATDEANVFTIEVNAENKGNLSRVFGAFKLVQLQDPDSDAYKYEPVFVDEIVLSLKRGNGKLKNPKTLIENMNKMPGGFKIAYTNLDEIDLSGATTEQQMVEITVTYRDGSTDIVEVPLRVVRN